MCDIPRRRATIAITWRSDAEIDRILELRERGRLSWRALAENLVRHSSGCGVRERRWTSLACRSMDMSPISYSLSALGLGARPTFSTGCGGRGTIKVARLMREFGHESPTVSLRDRAVDVTFAVPARTTGKTSLAVLRLLADDPSLSVPQLAARLKRSEITIHRAIRVLREAGRLARIGPENGGHWQVVS